MTVEIVDVLPDIPKFSIHLLDEVEPAEEQEQIPFFHSGVGQQALGGVGLSEGGLPALPGGYRSSNNNRRGSQEGELQDSAGDAQ